MRMLLDGAGVEPGYPPDSPASPTAYEGGVGPVGLDGQIPVLVVLVARHAENTRSVVLRLHPELQGVQGRVVARSAGRWCEYDLAVPLQQGPGVQQAGDELGGHVARQDVRPSSSPHRQHFPVLLLMNAPSPGRGRSRAPRRFHQPPVAGGSCHPLRAGATGMRKRRVEPLSPQSIT